MSNTFGSDITSLDVLAQLRLSEQSRFHDTGPFQGNGFPNTAPQLGIRQSMAQMSQPQHPQDDFLARQLLNSSSRPSPPQRLPYDTDPSYRPPNNHTQMSAQRAEEQRLLQSMHRNMPQMSIHQQRHVLQQGQRPMLNQQALHGQRPIPNQQKMPGQRPMPGQPVIGQRQMPHHPLMQGQVQIPERHQGMPIPERHHGLQGQRPEQGLPQGAQRVSAHQQQVAAQQQQQVTAQQQQQVTAHQQQATAYQRQQVTAQQPQQVTAPAAPRPIPRQPVNSNLSVSAIEFVPTFRKAAQNIVLYSYETFKKKSRSDDEMAINDVKTKLVKLFNTPQGVEGVMKPAVDTIKNWTTSILTYHQIVEDIFEFSIDEVNHPNFVYIGSKVLNYLTKHVPPCGDPPLTFFDVLVQKCQREYENCLKLEPSQPPSQERVKNVALLIADLFDSIKEGELRVFLFAEQTSRLCSLLVRIRTLLTIETVAKIFLMCGRDLKGLVDPGRFSSIIERLEEVNQMSLDNKTRQLVERVLTLDRRNWETDEEQQLCHNNAKNNRRGNKETQNPRPQNDDEALQQIWNKYDNNQSNNNAESQEDVGPVKNASEWDEYATDDFDDEWLASMLKLEDDDFSDVESDFIKFLEETQKQQNNPNS